MEEGGGGNPDSAELSRHCFEKGLQRDARLLRTFHVRLAILVENETWSDELLSQEDSNRTVHRREWRENLLPHLPSLREKTWQPRLLHHLAREGEPASDRPDGGPGPAGSALFPGEQPVRRRVSPMQGVL